MAHSKAGWSYRGYHYIETAITTLARGTGTIQERLTAAAPELVTCTMPGSMPKDLVGELEKAMHMVSHVDADSADIPGKYAGQGTIVATCMTMTDAEAQAAVDQIIHLKTCLDEL